MRSRGGSPDLIVLVIARVVRMFAYGALSVILALYLAEVGLSVPAIGLLFTSTLLGDALVSLALTTSADRFGRRRTLIVGALLMAAAGMVFAASDHWLLLGVAATLGVISPTGNEIGPFLSIEQAALTELVDGRQRTRTFAWYHVAASFAGAFGALASGWSVVYLERNGFTTLAAYRLLLAGYAIAGLVLTMLFSSLSPAAEPPVRTTAPPAATRFGLHRSRGVVWRLSALFMLDSFAGGFVLQSLIALWFHRQFGADEATIGGVLFCANLVAGLTTLSAVRLAEKIGLIRTMFVTHLPSNVLLALVPFMPTLPLAITVLILRFSISQMDVPTRQSYVVAVVSPDERSAAAGMTTIARSLGAAVSPALSGLLLVAVPGAPFVISGGLKILYDLLLYRGFKALPAPEERGQVAPPQH